MIRCTQCGYKNSPVYHYCGVCGAVLQAAPKEEIPAAKPTAVTAAPVAVPGATAPVPPPQSALPSPPPRTERADLPVSGGMSFLGLSDAPSSSSHSYLLDDEEEAERSVAWGRILVVRLAHAERRDRAPLEDWDGSGIAANIHLLRGRRIKRLPRRYRRRLLLRRILLLRLLLHRHLHQLRRLQRLMPTSLWNRRPLQQRLPLRRLLRLRRRRKRLRKLNLLNRLWLRRRNLRLRNQLRRLRKLRKLHLLE